MYRRSRVANAAAAAALAAVLVCSAAALPHREQEGDRASSADHSADSRLDANGHKVRTLDALGGGNLVRGVREARRSDYGAPYIGNRHYDYFGPYAGKRELLRPAYRYIVGLYGDNDVPKRNFDEIDRTGFNNDRFMKRNFDEIDSTGFNTDRFYKRNFDEIDHTGFGTFLKRSPASARDADYPLPPYALRFYDRDLY